MASLTNGVRFAWTNSHTQNKSLRYRVKLDCVRSNCKARNFRLFQKSIVEIAIGSYLLQVQEFLAIGFIAFSGHDTEASFPHSAWQKV